MEVIAVLNLIIGLCVLVLSVANARIMLRLVESLTEEEAPPPVTTEERRVPTYADLAVMGNYDGISPRAPNDDGVGGLIDK